MYSRLDILLPNLEHFGLHLIGFFSKETTLFFTTEFGLSHFKISNLIAPFLLTEFINHLLVFFFAIMIHSFVSTKSRLKRKKHCQWLPYLQFSNGFIRLRDIRYLAFIHSYFRNAINKIKKTGYDKLKIKTHADFCTKNKILILFSRKYSDFV